MRTRLGLSLLLAMMTFVSGAFAADGSLLKPPAGARVAVVVFEDLECPSCAAAYPVIWQNANASHVPVVLHDFPLKKHPWAFQAALYGRFFDTKNTKAKNLGNDFRAYIYDIQSQITPDNLRQYAQKFADEHHVVLPGNVDPQGKLKSDIQDDLALGDKCKLEHTPTIFVVAGGSASPSFFEVTNLDNLSAIIQSMQKNAGPAPSPTPARRAATNKGH